MSRIYRVWLERLSIEHETLPESKIVALGHRLSWPALSNLTTEEARTLLSMVQGRALGRWPIRVEPEQAEKGLKWLRDNTWTPTGKLRKSPALTPFCSGVLQGFDHFELVDYFNVRLHLGQAFDRLAPVYRTVALDGSWFDYCVTHNATDVMMAYSLRRGVGRRIEHGSDRCLILKTSEGEM